jgi:hypothetical protein
VLSLGTGDYIPDPLKEDSGRGLLFWAMNIAEVALAA